MANTPDFFDQYDFTITINEKFLDDISFSLENELSDKYDFVTLILREIAKGIGISCNLRGNNAQKKVFVENYKPTYFESLVLESLNTKDNSIAYTKATTGSLPINVGVYGNLDLYAPTTWEDGISLNSFIKADNENITNILDHNFAKGYINRDIADHNILYFFYYALGWQTAIYTGNISSGSSTGTSTDKFIPYKGSITLPTNKNSYKNHNRDNAINTIVRDYNGNDSTSTYVDVKEISLPYSSRFGEYYARLSDEFIICFLKKDGTWDLIDNIPVNSAVEAFNLSGLQLHFPDNDYARTCDGYLRCRITRTSIDRVDNIVFSPHYYVIDDIPQIGQLDFIGPANEIEAYSSPDDEYVHDVKIGIKNLEGTNKVIVEQLDEGARLPIKYEVTDFKKGYFIATVDKEFETKLTAIYYNDNGSTRSEQLIINPASEQNINIEIYDNSLKIKCLNTATYKILPLNIYGTSMSLTGIYKRGDSIDTTTLPKGLYLIRVQTESGKILTKKIKL